MKAQSIRLALCNWLASVCVQSEKSVKKCWAASQLTIISWKSSQLKRLSEWVKEIYRESCCCGRVYYIYTISSLAVLQNGLDIYRERCRGRPLYITQCGFYRLPIHPVRERARWCSGLWGRRKNQSSSITQSEKRGGGDEKWQSLR